MADEEQEEIEAKPKKFSPKNKKILFGAIAVIVIVIVAVVFLAGDDGFNGNGSDTNHAPSANGGEPERTVYVGEKVRFDASNSSDVDGDELTYSWDIGGEIRTGKVVTYEFDIAKLWYVNLTVNDGKLSDVYTIKVTVKVKAEITKPTVELSQQGIPATPITGKKYIVTVTSSTPPELLDNFSFAIIDDDTSSVIVKMDIKDILNSQGNMTFFDTPPVLNRLDTADEFAINPDAATLDAEDGDMFVIYYKLEGVEEKVAEVELETTGLP